MATAVKDEEETQEETGVVGGSDDAALADAEGRDRSDSNELQSATAAQPVVPHSNMSDAALRGAGVGSVADGDFGAEPPAPAKLSDAEKKRQARFAKLSGIEVEDIAAFNASTGVGVTYAGGKYQMNRKGTQLRHLAGPVPPGVITDREQAEQERLEKEANAEAES